MISTTRWRNLTAVFGKRYPFMMSANHCALRSKFRMLLGELRTWNLQVCAKENRLSRLSLTQQRKHAVQHVFTLPVYLTGSSWECFRIKCCVLLLVENCQLKHAHVMIATFKLQGHVFTSTEIHGHVVAVRNTARL